MSGSVWGLVRVHLPPPISYSIHAYMKTYTHHSMHAYMNTYTHQSIHAYMNTYTHHLLLAPLHELAVVVTQVVFFEACIVLLVFIIIYI